MATANDFDEARRAHGDSAVVWAIDSARRPAPSYGEPPAHLDEADAAFYGGAVTPLEPMAIASLSGQHANPVKVQATPYVWRDPSTIKPREWIYGRSIQRGHVRAVVAQGGAGKTILSIGEALCMATARDFLGQAVPGGPKRVWLWNLEDDGDELARIIQAACLHWNIAPGDIRDRLFVDSALDGAPLKLASSTNAAGLVINRPLVDALTDEMKGRGIDYLHVDPFVSSHSANESDNMEIDAIAKEWAMVAKNADAGVGLAHHISKAGAAEATAMHARGAVALINACRSVLVLNRMSEDEAKRYGIEDERRRRFFRVYDDKNNRAPPSDKSDWYQMISVDLGNGATGSGDSMGVVIPWSAPDAFEGVTADHLRRVQSAVDAGSWKESSQAKNWVGIAVANVMGLDPGKDAKADRARITSLLATWVRNGALVVVERRCPEKREDKKFVEVGEWAVDGIAPPTKGGAGQGGASGTPEAPRPTPPPIGGGAGGAGAAGGSKVGRGNRTPARQAATSPSAIDCPAQAPGIVLAPGESGDDVDLSA